MDIVQILVYTFAFSLAIDLGRAVLELLLNFRRNRDFKILKCPIFVIPCHNSEDVIEETISSLPDGCRVICVLNACSDKTEEVVEKIGWVEILKTEKPGKIYAVLLGALHAKSLGYSYIVQIDDDVVWPDKKEVGIGSKTATGFPVIPVKATNWIHAQQMLEYKMMCISKRGQSSFRNIIMASGAGGVYEIDPLLEVLELHDGDHVGDDLQCSLLHHQLDYKIDFNETIVIETHPPVTIKSWWKQRAKRWEISPIQNLPLTKGVFSSNSGLIVKTVMMYRNLVILNDIGRLSVVAVAWRYPSYLLGILLLSYLCVSLKLIAFRLSFKKGQATLWGWVALVTYPLYAILTWASRLYATPKGIKQLWRLYIKKERETLKWREK